MNAHRVYYMDALIVKYADDGVTPLHCDVITVKTRRGDKSDGYGRAVEKLQELGMVESGWRVSGVGYPDEMETSMFSLCKKCAANRQRMRKAKKG